MFSRLDPILRPIVRRTESTDAGLHIRRDESKSYDEGKGRGNPEDYTPIEWDELAEVSTAALRAFLQSLLHGPAAASAAPAGRPAPEEPKPGPTTLGSRATQAYQTMGRVVHDKNVVTEASPNLPPVTTDDPHPETAVLGHEFGPDEIRLVEQFIGDLIELERRSIADLTIQRSLPFLESIKLAIADGQARIGT